MEDKRNNTVEVSGDHEIQDGGHRDDDSHGPPIVFLRERSLFGDAKVPYQDWIKHEELYRALGESINVTHISGLQRVNGLWRIYTDNVCDKVTLLQDGVHIRGKHVALLPTNPYRLDTENTLRVRVQNIPLSADDGLITRELILKECEVISIYREKLRINGKLTNCETGDRIVNVKKSTVKEPLPRFMSFGKFRAKVIHKDQTPQVLKCRKCFQTGHNSYDCRNDWVCSLCMEPGHKQNDCPRHEIDPSDASDTCLSESESTDDEQKNEPEVPKRLEKTKMQTSNKENAQATPKEPRARNQNKKQKQKQQTPIDKFMTDHSNSKENRKTRSKSVVRSPPTPVEKIHETSKKQKGNT